MASRRFPLSLPAFRCSTSERSEAKQGGSHRPRLGYPPSAVRPVTPCPANRYDCESALLLMSGVGQQVFGRVNRGASPVSTLRGIRRRTVSAAPPPVAKHPAPTRPHRGEPRRSGSAAALNAIRSASSRDMGPPVNRDPGPGAKYTQASGRPCTLERLRVARTNLSRKSTFAEIRFSGHPCGRESRPQIGRPPRLVREHRPQISRFSGLTSLSGGRSSRLAA